ncbi:MAG: HAD family hydrolase [Promethearchaeota archaeon]
MKNSVQNTSISQNPAISQKSTLYISDLDGTLMDGNQQIPPESVEIINQFIAEGNLFSIATARAFESSYPKIKNLNLNLPIICHNGTFIYDPQQKSPIKSYFLKQEFVTELLEIYKKLKLNPLIYAINEENRHKVYFAGANNVSEQNYIEDRLENKDPRFEKVDQMPIKNQKIFEINIITPDNQVKNILKYIPTNPDIFIHKMNDIYTPGFTWIEVVPREGNKKDALIYLKNYLQVDRVVCFGDNTNDIPMFEAADEGCAVENAIIELKNIATRIIPKNTENGVVRYLQQIMKRLER